MNLTIAIPVFQPGEAFVELVRELSNESVCPIFVVDDGSGPAHSSRFDRVGALPGVHILRHAGNRGKGAALKTAMKAALAAFPASIGVVTADGDGQHSPGDIMRIASTLLEHPDSLCLGTRCFGDSVPWRSRVGNRFTRTLSRFVLPEPIQDTQTGLRGIPAILVPELLRIAANGYEFELEGLMRAMERGVRIVEKPIATIYEDGNRSSHFRPALDSARILWVLARHFAARPRYRRLPGNTREAVRGAPASVTEE